MDTTPIIVSILFSMTAMILSAVVVARSEDHASDLRRKIAAMKLELERVSREHSDISRKTLDAHKAVAALEQIHKAEIELLKSDHAASISALAGQLTEINAKMSERGWSNVSNFKNPARG